MKRLLFLLMLVCHGVVFAKSDTQFGELKNGTLLNGSTLSVNGNRYAGIVNTDPLTRTFWIDKVYGLVKLSIPMASQATTGTASVTVDITYLTEGPNGFVSNLQSGVVLTVNVGTDNATDASYYLAPNAQSVQINVINVVNSGLTDLALNVSVVTESFDYMTFSDVPAAPVHSTTLTAGGSLPVSWGSVANAESYELEWTYISNQGATPGTTIAFSDLEIPPFYFRNNSSRVEVTATNYQIPLVYEAGYILYRVRAIGKAVVNSTAVWVKSNWTYYDNGTTAYPEANAYLYAGLENNINWQSSLSFAEEGKHKVVVSYHDGSSRNRQAVTRINTDGRAVIGETFYDYNGRPIVQTLPVPVPKDSLGFYPHFNVVEGQSIMHKDDIVAVSPNACAPSGAQLSTQTGSSNYYSPANTFTTGGTNTQGDVINKDYIPDAKKYPYSQMVYTPDNTGRVATQSGFGEANYLGSGNETEYMYATPLQTELCRLFGTQVGYAGHYKKNAVIDPNGQVSVSYLDLDGKVIATALAGGAPQNVSNLGNDNNRSISEDIIKTNPMSNVMSADSTSLTFNKKFVVTSNNLNYAFGYTGEFGYYDIPCRLNNTYMHIDGVVDITVTLKDKCGAVVFSTTRSTTQGNTGTRQTVAPINQTAILSIGDYQLTKTAVINEDKLSAYTQTYLASSCAKQLADFKIEEEAKIDLVDCNMTCATCATERDRLLKLDYLTNEQKEDIKNLCKSVCGDSIGCSASLNSMKGDMSPGGQYAQLREDRVQMPQNVNVANAPNGTVAFANMDNIGINNDGSDVSFNDVHPELFPLSIFNPNNKIPIGSYLQGMQTYIGSSSEYWRFPIKITRTGDVIHPKNYQILNDEKNPIELTANTKYSLTDYLDEKGEIFYVYIQKTVHADNSVSYSPQILDTTGTALKLVDPVLNMYKIPVRYLKNPADFESNWKPYWGYALLPYHPEFPYYIACILQNSSNDFDYALMNTSFADAQSKGFVDENGIPTVFEKEGALNAHVKPVVPYTAWMELNIQHYGKQGVSMVVLANRLTNCPKGDAETNACGTATVVCDKIKIETEQEWSTYRSLYFSIKQQFLKDLDNFKAVNGAYYNGCIGHSNYITQPEAVYFDQFRLQQVNGTVKSCTRILGFKHKCGWRNITYDVYAPSYAIQSQLCYIGNAHYLKDKTQRFYVTGVGDNSKTQQAGNCPSVSYDVNGNPKVTLVPCDADLISQQNDAIEDAQRLKYELCGLCPVASDVESLLMQLTANNSLSSANRSISCQKDNIIIGDALQRLILTNVSSNPVIYWVSSLAGNKKSISGSIKINNTNVYTLTLAIPASAGNLTFDQIISVCCMNPSQQNVNAFTLKASFKLNGIYSDVWLDGSMNLDLKNCDINPKCVLTEDATNVATLLNLLSSDGNLNPATPVHLFDGIADANDDGNRNVDKYFDAVLGVLRMTDELNDEAASAALNALDPVWSTSSSASVISGTLTYTLNGISKTLLIEIISSPGGFTSTPLLLPTNAPANFSNQPKQFYSLSTISYKSSCSDACGSTFGASMIDITNNQLNVQKVVISVPLLTPVKCTTIIPATVNRISSQQ